MSSSANQVDTESVWRLISHLTPQAGWQSGNESVLQARLLLKLAEIRDQEELEIQESLARIDSQGLAMFQGVVDGDDDDALEFGFINGHEGRQSCDTIEKRLWAWAQLYFVDPRSAEHWLVTTTPAVMAVICDLATSTFDNAPRPFLCLPLPSGAAFLEKRLEDYFDGRKIWQQQICSCLGELADILARLARTPGGSVCPPMPEELFSFHKRFPVWPDGGVGTLDFYLLPFTLPDLIAKFVGKKLQAATTYSPYTSAIVAVVNERGTNLAQRC